MGDSAGGGGIDPQRLTRFTGRAGWYARYRPSYPAAAIDAVLEGLPGAHRSAEGGVRWCGRAADIGAGTGISVRLLAQRGAQACAIEPNGDMRDAAGAHEGVTWIDGTAEATGLEPGSIDLVLCAQAFHWFEPGRALTEFRRVLVPGGRVALMWNLRREGDGFMDGYQALVTRHAVSRITSPWASGGDFGALLGEHIGPARHLVFDHNDELTAEETLGRAMSASYTPSRGWARDVFEGELMELFGRFERGGKVRWAYRTHVHVADAGD